MIENRPNGFSLGMLLVVFVAASNLLAEESEYQSDMKPGLTVRSDNTVLADAARSGSSVTIQEAQPEPEYGTRYAPKQELYTVREGDTLWDICDQHFKDPYVWPRIWSYNLMITNPNWIYPGDVIRLTPPQAGAGIAGDDAAGGGAEVGGSGAGGAAAGGGMAGGMGQQGSAGAAASGTRILRSQGFIDKDALKRAGTVVGANRALAMMGQFDEAYVEFKEKDDKKKKKKDRKQEPEEPLQVRVGDRFSLFRVIGPVKGGTDDPKSDLGKLVEILGEVRVTQFNPENRIARVMIEEVTKEIKRGTRVAAEVQKFKLVPPVTNNKDIEGRLIAVLAPYSMVGANHVVYIDRGTEHGVRQGNRFFAVEVRDRWKKSLGEADAREGFPKEVLAEIRVIEVRPQSSTGVITGSIRELYVGQKLEMRRGY